MEKHEYKKLGKEVLREKYGIEVSSNLYIDDSKPTEIEMPDVCSKLLKQKVSIKGMVSRYTEILNEKYQTDYRCKCNEIITMNDNAKPTICHACKVQSGFAKEQEHFRDFRDIEIEETLDNVDRQPEIINIRIIGDLLEKEEVKKLQVGQMVYITGIVDNEKIKVKNGKEIYAYYIICSAIKVLEYSEKSGKLTEEDMINIRQIARNNPLEQLSQSLAPSIYGYESIKKAIVLQLVRGPENDLLVRPRTNILIVSDPSLGKSVLARETHVRTPNSIYGSGDNMSSAGLCSAAIKDEVSGRWRAKAGILCRCNKSLAIIDEIDKLGGSDRDGLHTPMESGEVIVTKAGIHQRLKADCSVLACCNPVNGSFDSSGYSSVKDTTGLPTAIISRFDLIFYIKDVVDEERDKKIIKRLLGEEIPEPKISKELFRKYITYVKEIQPKYSKEVEALVLELYIKLRNASRGTSDKVDPRQAGGLLRLAVANAKIRMSETVEMEDFDVAETLVLDSFESQGFARNLNALDQAGFYTGITKKKMNVQLQVKELIKYLIINGKEKEKDLEDEMLSKGFNTELFQRIFDGLKRDGSIIGNRNNLQWIN